MISKIEKDFQNACLDQGIRLDDRDFETFRDISIKKLSENGQVQVNIGKTSAICQIHSSLISPHSDKPGEGILIFTTDTSNLKHQAESNNSNDDLNELRNRLGNMLEKSLKDTK